jgi:HEPN domain-containing protein
LKSIKAPTNAKEFNELMVEIDERLRSRQIPVPLRVIESFREISKELGLQLIIALVQPPLVNDYSEASLSGHIVQWFQDRYGETLKLDMSPASAVILVKGDPYRLTIPVVYGRGRFVMDRTFSKRKHITVGTSTSKPDPIEINVYELIKGITPTLINSLNESEIKQIMTFVAESYDCIYKLDESRSLPYKAEAKTDLKIAVDIILTEKMNYGMSKWASLQFVEKLIKGILKMNKVDYPKTHKLQMLNTLLSENKLPNVPIEVLSKIECTPSVRYEKNSVSRSEAIIAHHSSLEAVKHLFLKGHNHIKLNY